MMAKSDRFQSMRNAAEMSDIARQAASALVDRQERNTGSRMAAYENVGSMIGASGSWVRRFVGGGEAGLSFPVGLNILSVFERWMDREIEIERTKIDALKRRINDATPKALRIAAPEIGTARTGKNRPASARPPAAARHGGEGDEAT